MLYSLIGNLIINMKATLLNWVLTYKYQIAFWVLFTIYFQLLGGNKNDPD